MAEPSTADVAKQLREKLVEQGAPTLEEIFPSRKKAVKQYFQAQEDIFEQIPEAAEVVPDLALAKIEEKEKPAVSQGSEAAELAQIAKVKGEGFKLDGTQQRYLGQVARNSGLEDTPEARQKLLKNARNYARHKQKMAKQQYEALNIDAMQRFGKQYRSPQELLQNYTIDAQKAEAEAEAVLKSRPTMAPNSLMQVVGQDGKELTKGPGWIGVVDKTTDLWRSKAMRPMVGTPTVMTFGMDINEEEVQKTLAGGADAKTAARHGYHHAEMLLGNPFEFTGPTAARNVRVYVNQAPNGVYGLNPQAYKQLYALHWLDFLLSKKGLGSITTASYEDVEPLREEAQRLANRDVAGLMHRNRVRGHIMVDLDPRGTNEAIVRGEKAFLWNWDANLMRAMGATTAADYLTKARAPLVALAHPTVALSPTGEISYGQSILDIQTEHPMHWFLRAGGWTMFMSWYLDPDPEMEWGSLKHVQKIRSGYDFTQDAPELGKRIAYNAGYGDSETFQVVAGISAAIMLAITDPDLPSLALLGVGKPLAVAAKLGRIHVATAFATKGEKLLGGLEVSPTIKNLRKIVHEDPLFGQPLITDFSVELAKEGLDASFGKKGVLLSVERAITRQTADTGKALVAEEKVKTARRAANTKAQAAEEKVREETAGALKSVRDAHAKHWANIQNMEAALGREAAQFERSVTDLEMRVLQARHAAQIAEAKAQALGMGVTDMRRAMRGHVTKAGAKGTEVERKAVAALEEAEARELKSSKRAGEVGEELYAARRAVLDMQQAIEKEWFRRARPEGAVETGLLPSEGPAGTINLERARLATRATAEGGKHLKAAEALVAKLERLSRATSRTSASWAKTVAEAKNALAQVRTGKPIEIMRNIANKVIIDDVIHTKNLRKALEKDLERKLRSGGRSLEKSLDRLERARKPQKSVSVEHKVLKAADKTRKILLSSNKALLDAADRTRETLLRSNKALLDANQPLKDPEQIVKEIIQRIAGNQRKAYGAYVKLQKAGRPTQVGQSELVLGDSVTRRLQLAGEEQTGTSILEAFEKIYGPMADWGTAAKADMVKRLVNRGDHAFELDRSTGNILFDTERIIRDGSLVKRTLGDAVLGSAMELVLFDPDAFFVRQALRWSPAEVLARGYRFAAGIRRWTSPSQQMFGALGPRMEATSRRSIEHLNQVQKEMAGILKMGATPWDLLEYLTSSKVFKLRDGIATANMDTKVMFTKWKDYVLGAVSKEGVETVPALEAVVRMALPPDDWGTAAVGPARAKVLSLLRGEKMEGGAILLDELDPREAFIAIIESVRDVTIAKMGTADREIRALRDALQGIALGAVLHDYHVDIARTVGPLTGDHARSMNLLLKWGRVEHPLTGKAGDIDLPLAYESFVLIGASYGSDKMRKLLQTIPDMDKTLHKWADAHPGLGYAPTQVVEYLNFKAGRIIKELEQYHNPKSGLEMGQDYILGWMTLWRMSVVMGLALPRITHFTNTFFGDMSQIAFSRGFGAAFRLSVGNAFTYIPIVGKPFQDALSDRARAGGIMALFINPHLGGVMRGGSRKVLTADGVFTEKELLDQASKDGVFDYILERELIDTTQRIGLEVMGSAQKLRRFAEAWPSHWTGFMYDIQSRQRMAVYLEDRVNRNLTRVEAKNNVHEIFFDWKHGATAFELRTIAKISAFYMFWRNAFNQMGSALLEPLVADTGNYAARALIGQTKLARARTQGQIAMATPEWYWWDDKDEILSDEEQLEAWRKRQTPWWLSARPFLTNVKVPEDARNWYRQNQGRNVQYETHILPMLTALDTLYLTSLMAQTGMAAVTSDVELSPEWWDDIEEELLNKLAPVFQEFVEGGLANLFGRETRHKGSKGVPLRAGEEEMLRWIGLLDFATVPGPQHEAGRRYVNGEMAQMISLLFRTTFVVGTEIPQWITALNNPHWERGAGAGARRALQSYFGIGRAYAFDPDSQTTYRVKRLEHLHKDIMKKRKRGAHGVWDRELLE